MYKSALKCAAVLVSVLACSLTCTSCGDDDDDDDDPYEVGSGGPTAITSAGHTLMTFAYDSHGRMTSFRSEDVQMSISYSPLTIQFEDDGDFSIMTDISVNSLGYITKAKVTDYYDGDQEVYWNTFSYDGSGHLIQSTADGEPMNFNWENGNLISISDDEYFAASYTYSNLKNSAGVASPMWGDLGIYIMTGLFGRSTANFPSAIYADEERMSFKYSLLDDGRINKETLSMNGYSMDLTYRYGGSRAGSADDNVSATNTPRKINRNIFRRIRK